MQNSPFLRRSSLDFFVHTSVRPLYQHLSLFGALIYKYWIYNAVVDICRWSACVRATSKLCAQQTRSALSLSLFDGTTQRANRWNCAHFVDSTQGPHQPRRRKVSVHLVNDPPPTRPSLASFPTRDGQHKQTDKTGSNT